MKTETALRDTDKCWEVRQVQPKNEKVEPGVKRVEKVRRTHQALVGRGLSK